MLTVTARVVLTVPGGGRQAAARGPDAEQNEGNIDEEGGAPAPVVSEPANEPTTDHRTDRHRDPDDGTEGSEGPPSGLTDVVLLDHAGHLRVEQSGADPHDQAGQVEGDDVGGEPRGQ